MTELDRKAFRAALDRLADDTYGVVRIFAGTSVWEKRDKDTLVAQGRLLLAATELDRLAALEDAGRLIRAYVESPGSMPRGEMRRILARLDATERT